MTWYASEVLHGDTSTVGGRSRSRKTLALHMGLNKVRYSSGRGCIFWPRVGLHGFQRQCGEDGHGSGVRRMGQVSMAPPVMMWPIPRPCAIHYQGPGLPVCWGLTGMAVVPRPLPRGVPCGGAHKATEYLLQVQRTQSPRRPRPVAVVLFDVLPPHLAAARAVLKTGKKEKTVPKRQFTNRPRVAHMFNHG